MQNKTAVHAPQPTGSPLLNDSDTSLLATFWDQHDPYSDTILYQQDGYNYYNPHLDAPLLESPHSQTFAFPGPITSPDLSHVKNIHSPQAYDSAHDSNTSALPITTTAAQLDDSQIGASVLVDFAQSSYRGTQHPRTQEQRRTASGTVSYGQDMLSNAFEHNPYNSVASDLAFAPSTQALVTVHRPGQPLPFGTDQSYKTSSVESYPTQGLIAPSNTAISAQTPYPYYPFQMSRQGQYMLMPDGPAQNPSMTANVDAHNLRSLIPLQADLAQRPVLCLDTSTSAKTRRASNTILDTITTLASESPSGPSDDLPSATSTSRKRRKSSNVPASARPRLSEGQKKERHIHSEQRRRDQIKDRFADLNRLVPALRSSGFSKAAVLQETVRFLEALVQGNNKARAEVERRIKQNIAL